jgi:hypothetical protein
MVPVSERRQIGLSSAERILVTGASVRYSPKREIESREGEERDSS